jgi:hypothetical protein
MKIWICASIPNTIEIDIVGGYISSYQEEFNPSDHFNLVGNIFDADIILVPHDAKHFSKNIEYLKYLRSLGESKQLLISNRSDFPVKIKLKNATFLRVGIEPGEKVLNSIVVPYNINPLSYLPFRDYQINPKLSFIGLVPKFSAGRTIKSLIKAPLHPGLSNPAIVRRLAIRQVKNSSFEQEIVERNKYGGLAKLVPNPQKNREQYVSSIKESDLILCPRGDSNGSLRFYETLSAGRIPLIPNTKIIFPYSENFNLKDLILRFSLFNSKIDPEITEFWKNLNLIKYQTIQEDLRMLYNTQYKFDIFLKNLLNSGAENFNKYILK